MVGTALVAQSSTRLTWQLDGCVFSSCFMQRNKLLVPSYKEMVLDLGSHPPTEAETRGCLSDGYISKESRMAQDISRWKDLLGFKEAEREVPGMCFLKSVMQGKDEARLLLSPGSVGPNVSPDGLCFPCSELAMRAAKMLRKERRTSWCPRGCVGLKRISDKIHGKCIWENSKNGN